MTSEEIKEKLKVVFDDADAISVKVTSVVMIAVAFCWMITLKGGSYDKRTT